MVSVNIHIELNILKASCSTSISYPMRQFLFHVVKKNVLKPQMCFDRTASLTDFWLEQLLSKTLKQIELPASKYQSLFYIP